MAYSAPWWNVGPGISARMEADGALPAGPSKYTNYNPLTLAVIPEGVPPPAHYISVEECWSDKGLYRASNFSGQWVVAGPFGGGEA